MKKRTTTMKTDKTTMKTMTTATRALLGALGLMAVLAGAAGAAHAQSVHGQVALTARLVNNGTPYDGDVTIQATLYKAETGGLGVWNETEHVTASAGLVALRLGAQSPIAPAIDGGDLYLEIAVNGTALSPRLAVGSVPYAARADHATTA